MMRLVVLALLATVVTVASRSHGNRNMQSLVFETIKYPNSESNVHSSSHRSKRKIYQFEMHPHKMWPTTIKYRMDERFNATQQDTIKTILAEDFEANTCLTFTAITSDQVTQEQYIYFKLGNEPGVCSTSVGMEHNIETIHGQPIYLGNFCFNNRNGVLYTVASTLGMLNEANRPDRENYVDIEWDHIRPDDMFNFAKHSSDYFDPHGIPYDYGSIMHMAPDRALIQSVGESNRTALTIVPKNRRFLYVPGQTVELSFYDLFSINDVYCNTSCGYTISCRNGGYQNPSDCSSCICRDGYSGSRCDDIDAGVSGCSPSSGYRTVTDQVDCVQSPGYGNRMPTQEGNWFTYQYGDRCSWQLNAPEGRLIDMWFEGIDLYSFPMSVYATCIHWVEIRYHGLEQARGVRYCDDSNRQRLLPHFADDALVPMSPAENLTSRSNQIMVMFKTRPYWPLDDIRDPVMGQDGFRLCYKLSSQRLEDLDPEQPQPTIPAPSQPPQQIQDEDDSGEKGDNLFLLVGAAIGALLLILIILVCVVLVVVCRKKRRLPTASNQGGAGAQAGAAGYSANTSTVIIHDSDINIAIARKEQEAANGAMHPGSDDPFNAALPTYKEHDPPPEYGQDGNEEGGDGGYEGMGEGAEAAPDYDTPYANVRSGAEGAQGHAGAFENPTYRSS